MQQQIYSFEYRESFKEELIKARNKYDDKRLKVEDSYFEKFNTPKEAIINFILDEKELIEFDDFLLKEEYELVMELKKQANFLNSPPQYKEGYKYISANGECLVIYQRVSEKEECPQYGQREEVRKGRYFLPLPPDPAIEENRILLN